MTVTLTVLSPRVTISENEDLNACLSDC